MTNSEFIFKITLIGDGAVGKTSIRNRYMGRGFKENHLMTLGADFSVIDKEFRKGETWTYQIWDIAGQKIFEEIRARFYKGSMGALVVFDVTDKQTLRNCLSWVKELYRFSGSEAIPVVLLANKSDLRNRRSVDMKKAKRFVKILNEGTASYGFTNHVLETSAKTGLNIETAFEVLGEAIRARF